MLRTYFSENTKTLINLPKQQLTGGMAPQRRAYKLAPSQASSKSAGTQHTERLPTAYPKGFCAILGLQLSYDYLASPMASE